MIAYKVVDNCSRSITAQAGNYYSVDYLIGKRIKATYPMFCFDTLDNARNFARMNCWTKILKCRIVRSRRKLRPGRLARMHHIDVYWAKKDYNEITLEIPRGTILADVVTPLEREYHDSL